MRIHFVTTGGTIDNSCFDARRFVCIFDSFGNVLITTLAVECLGKNRPIPCPCKVGFSVTSS